MRVTCGGVLRGRSQGLAALARLGRKEPGEKLTVESKSNSQTLPCTLKQTEAARGCSRTAMTCSLAVPSEPTQGTHTGTKAHTGTRAHTRTRTHTGISGQAEKWIQQDPSQGRPHPSLRQRSARSPASANGATAECATSWDPLNTQFLDPPGPGEVHVWCVDPDLVLGRPDLMEEYEGMLSEEEREQLGSAESEDVRRQRLLTRALARVTIARYCGGEVHPCSIEFRRNAWGKPEVSSECGISASLSSECQLSLSRIQFNLSHTRGLVAVAVNSDAAVGLDVEGVDRMVGRNAMLLARRRFAAEEAQWLASLADKAAQGHAFVKLWTLKEAFVKALGLGMTAVPFRSFSVSLTDDQHSEHGTITLKEAPVAAREPPHPGQQQPQPQAQQQQQQQPQQLPQLLQQQPQQQQQQQQWQQQQPRKKEQQQQHGPGALHQPSDACDELEEKRVAWRGRCSGFQMLLLQPRDEFLMSLCVDNSSPGERLSKDVKVLVNWTIPLERDYSQPCTILAASENASCHIELARSSRSSNNVLNA